MNLIPQKCFSVSCFLVRKNSTDDYEVLLLLRSKGAELPSEWCQVAGTIEDHETATDAVIREVFEETGIMSMKLYSTMECEQYYRPDLNCISLLPVFVGFVPENQTVTLNEEHTEFCWVSFNDAGELLPLPVQRRMLLSIQREFIDREPSSLLLVKSEA